MGRAPCPVVRGRRQDALKEEFPLSGGVACAPALNEKAKAPILSRPWSRYVTKAMPVIGFKHLKALFPDASRV